MTGVVDLRLVPAALTAWLVTAAGITWGTGPVLSVVFVAVAVLWWLAGRCLGGRVPGLRAAVAGVAGVAAVGAGFGLAAGLRSDAALQHPLTRLVGATVEVTVTPTESPRAVGGGRLVFPADLVDAGAGGTGGRVVVFGSAHEFAGLTAGRPARFRARVASPRRRDLTVSALTATSRPEFGQASAVQRAAAVVRDRLASAAREVLPTEQSALLPGLVLGDTSAIPAAVVAQFRTAGLTHLTAVSGANVTIVCGAVLLSAALIGPRAAAALAAVALLAFVVVVQPSASVLRAAVMGSVALVAVFSARRRHAIPALSATVIVLMLTAPQLSVDIGFALSVSATAALALLAPVWSARLVDRGWPKPIADAVALATAAQLVTAPLIAAISGKFSLVAVLANICVAPVIPPITLLGTAAAVLCPVWPAAAGLLLRFTGPELWWLLTVARTAGSIPGAAVPVPAGWAGLLVVGASVVVSVLLWRHRWFRWVAGGAGLCAVAWSLSGLVGAT